MTTIMVDEDVLDFLRVIYFGAYEDAYEAASSRAYRDMNRTIRFMGMDERKRSRLRAEVTKLLRFEISNLIKNSVKDQEQFDEWHFSVCAKIRFIYRDGGIVFTFGQAQKWLNMFCKYLYIIGETSFENVFAYLHIPLDNFILDAARKQFGVSKPTIAWSRIDDYESQYMKYQRKLRIHIQDMDPLRWEFKYWIKEARSRRSTE